MSRVILTSILVFLSTFLGCANVNTLGLKQHVFGQAPKKIIWFQLAGFSEEHLALLRLNQSDQMKSVSFENFDCLGKMWNFDLYYLRPKANNGFWSQMTGSMNLTPDNERFKLKPFWKYFSKLGEIMPVAILESGIEEMDSLATGLYLKEADPAYRDGMTLVRMGPAEGKDPAFFHHTDLDDLEKGIYYDKSCQQAGCYSSLLINSMSLYKRFTRERQKYIIMIRDFSYLSELKAGRIMTAREVLNDISKLITFFLQEEGKYQDMLVLVTGSESLRFEFPDEGKDWQDFESNGKKILFRSSSLFSPSLAKGSGAENFCGIYEQFSIFKRLLWREQKFDLLNILGVKTDD